MKLICTLILLLGLQVKAEELGVVAPPTTSLAGAPTSVSAQVTKDTKETDIPVNLEVAKKTAGPETPILKFILSFGIIGVMGCAAYFLLRKYKFKNNSRDQAMQIKVLTQHYLGPKKSLAIVRVAGESILIGVTDHNISMIKSLSLLDEDIPEETPKEFQSVFNRKTAEPSFVVEAESKDEFSISGIRDIVSGKLKNMRNLE
jgi:flagellar protein FliO/FliZ